MPIQTINIDKVDKQLARLLAVAKSDGEIVIAHEGKPLARLETVVPAPKKKRMAGLNKGNIWTSEDFDEPLPDDFWLGKK